ncbi:MAG TPA: ROK family protein [Planctomycetota bacterium]|nr:ROK family protein [Planctomycetota bacterium]
MSLAVGIEIGGTKLQAGVGLRDGKLAALVRRTVDPSKGGAGIREQIPSLIEEAISKAGCSPKDLVGLGVGFGGPVDSKRGRILVSHQIEGWADFPLRDWLQKKVEVPVVLQNDAKTAALAEATLGTGKGLQRIFYITVGSGVGGGLVIDGVPDVGQGLGAGEIGHTWVSDPDSGKPEKLEHVASGWSIGKRGSRRFGRELSGADVAALAGKGDAVARKTIEESAEALAIGIGNVLALLHPERFIVGGGVSLMGDLWWGPLRRALAEKYAFAPFAQSYEVVPSALGEEVVVIGAVLLGLSVKKA